MDHIDHLDVEGFKGIRSLSLEPKAINVVTGRNNTGKTSLLEGIEVGCNPKILATFGDNVDSVVHVDEPRATITVAANGLRRELSIQYPDEERARDLLRKVAYEAAATVVERWEIEDDISDEELESIRDQLRDIVIDNVDDSIVAEAVRQILLLSVDGDEEYEYVSSRGPVTELFEGIGGDLSELYTEFREDHTQTSLLDYGLSSGHAFQNVMMRRHPFVGEVPPRHGDVTFVDSGKLLDTPEVGDGETDAVKIDDIEEFLIETGIAEDLRSFDLDYLVFTDENGEKYSVPYDFMGDGFKAIVGVLWELFDDVSGNVVLLEEPGSHMHPGYVRELVYFLVSMARESGVQLFVTTHNNDFVADFFGETLTDAEREFLEAEFQLVQMQGETADVMSYAEAEEQLKELHLDLRGL